MELVLLLSLFLTSYVSSENDIRSGNNRFAIDLYNNLVTGHKNEAFSPFSLHTALSLTYEGSVNETEALFKDKLYLPSKTKTADKYKDLLTKVTRTQNVTFNVANKVLAKTGYNFVSTFEDIATRNFLAETGSINFEDGDAAANEINSWVNKATNGKWDVEFKAERTRTEPFYVDETETVDVPMMHQTGDFYYGTSSELDASLLKLRFRDPRFSLIIVLPNSKTGINRLEEGLKRVDVNDLLSNFGGAEVEVSLPRFKIESEHKLKDALTKLGLGDIFDGDKAKFPDIIKDVKSLEVKEVIHKVTIEINEEGGEAAAASGVIISIPLSSAYVPPPPIVFKADHPFIFLLTAGTERDFREDYRNSVTLILGKVVTPENVS
ncbi:hypothetical protein Trydic_g12743 [Trypoxylus dichotomus]